MVIQEQRQILLRCNYCEKVIKADEAFNDKWDKEYDGVCNNCKKILNKLKSKERLLMRLKALAVIKKHE